MTVARRGLKVKAKELAQDRNVWQELVVIGVVYSDRMIQDSDKWRKYVHGVWPTLGSRTSKERNRTEQRKNKKKCPRDTKYVAVYCLKEIELENRQISTSMRVWFAILCINEKTVLIYLCAYYPEPERCGEGTRGTVTCKISWHERARNIGFIAEKTGTEGLNYCSSTHTHTHTFY